MDVNPATANGISSDAASPGPSSPHARYRRSSFEHEAALARGHTLPNRRHVPPPAVCVHLRRTTAGVCKHGRRGPGLLEHGGIEKGPLSREQWLDREGRLERQSCAVGLVRGRGPLLTPQQPRASCLVQRFVIRPNVGRAFPHGGLCQIVQGWRWAPKSSLAMRNRCTNSL